MAGKQKAHLGEVGAEAAGTGEHRHVQNTLPAERCKYFTKCAVNRCPLTPRYERLETLPSDPGRTCRATKAHRIAVAAQYPDITPYHGMTRMEYSRTPAHNLPERRKNATDPAYMAPASEKGAAYG